MTGHRADELTSALTIIHKAVTSELTGHRVDMATTLTICSGLDPGKVVRTMNGKSTGAWQNIDKILDSVCPFVSDDD